MAKDNKTKIIIFGAASLAIILISFLFDDFSLETKDQSMRQIALVISYSIYLLIFIPLFEKSSDKKKQNVKKYIFNLAITYILIQLVKVIFSRLRPDQLGQIVPQQGFIAAFNTFGFSFPSSHAALSFFVAWQCRKFKYAWIIWIWASAVALSRLVLGVHFISDVLGGILLGVFLNIALNYKKE